MSETVLLRRISRSAPVRRRARVLTDEHLRKTVRRPAIADRDRIFDGRSAPQPLGGFNETVGGYPERLGQSFDDVERWRFAPVLEVTDVCAVHTRFLGEFFLRPAGLLSKVPDDETECGSEGDMGAVDLA